MSDGGSIPPASTNNAKRGIRKGAPFYWSRRTAIVRNLAALGIPKDHVKILLREIPKENWGIRGGQAAVDIDIGFKIEV